MRISRFMLFALSLALRTSGVAGQTRFAWPDTAVNFSRYRYHIEECEAAVQRSATAAHDLDAYRRAVWFDTMPRKDAPYFAATVGRVAWQWPTVAAAAQRCLAQDSVVDSVPLDRYREYMRLYLAAGWPAKVKALMGRRLATTTPNEMYAVFDAVLNIVGMDTEAGLVLVDELVRQYESKLTNPVDRALLYFTVFNSGDGGFGIPGDSVRALRAAARVVTFVSDSLTDAQRQEMESRTRLPTRPPSFQAWIQKVYDQRFAKPLPLLDSLRKSTASYFAFLRNYEPEDVAKTAAGKDTAFGGLDLISFGGVRAVPIRADVWAGRAGLTEPRPTPGRISLVVFFDAQACSGHGEPLPTPMPREHPWQGRVVTDWLDLHTNCAATLVPLRRVTERFRALEITVIARTYGYFQYLRSTTPVQEAELTRQLLASYGIPAAVAMVTEKKTWLPAPDGRRVDQTFVDSNWVYYSRKWREYPGSMIGKKLESSIGDSGPSGYAFLVDKEGNIVVSGDIRTGISFGLVGVDDLADYIQALLVQGVVTP